MGYQLHVLFRRVDGKDAAGNTPLIDLCGGARAHRDAARLLLDAGADVNARSRPGRTPLLAAVMHANPDLIEYLLRCELRVRQTSVT
jgi:ankyrin repeat protein